MKKTSAHLARIGYREALKLAGAVGLAASLAVLRGASVGEGSSVNVTLDVREVDVRPALNDDCTDNHNQFHGLNTTNLHTRGLDVSPTLDSTGEFDADNVFLKVVPKDQLVACEDQNFRRHEASYRFELPADYPTGSYWYPAHKHGATARQVGAGRSGSLIIKDPPGVLPSYIEQATEKVFMVMNQGGVLANPAGGGTFEPTIRFSRGEVERWRLLKSTPPQNSFVHLRPDAPDLEIYQIAYDGLTLPRRVRVDQNDSSPPWENPAAIGPGNRTDLLVRVPPDAKDQTFGFKLLQGLQELLRLDDAFISVLPLEVEIAGERARFRRVVG